MEYKLRLHLKFFFLGWETICLLPVAHRVWDVFFMFLEAGQSKIGLPSQGSNPWKGRVLGCGSISETEGWSWKRKGHFGWWSHLCFPLRKSPPPPPPLLNKPPFPLPRVWGFIEGEGFNGLGDLQGIPSDQLGLVTVGEVRLGFIRERKRELTWGSGEDEQREGWGEQREREQ